MRGSMSVKKKLIFASKILLSVFCILLFVIIMGLAYTEEGKEADWLAFLLLPFLLIGILMVIFFLIEFILEVWERWKENGIRDVVRIPVEGILYMLVFMGCDLLISKEVTRFRGYIGYGVILMIVMTVMGYWKRVGKQK